ncbi:MAG: peptidoglycan-binding protein, partial [Clostridiales bacterium]|nr:peptidoglycan-binding protein [Clostridiales bacterium]
MKQKKFISLLLVLAMVFSLATAFAAPGTLKLKDNNKSVGDLTLTLKALGYYEGDPTNVYSEYVKTCVIRFQKAVGLKATGEADYNTIAKLNQLITAPSLASSGEGGDKRDLKAGSVGGRVKDLTAALKALGYYEGDPTEEFNAYVKTCVIRFQRAVGLQANGIAGNKTIAKLNDLTRVETPAAPSKDIVKAGEIGETAPLQVGAKGGRVKDLTSALRKLSYYGGEPTDEFTSYVKSCVIDFQKAVGLRANGIADYNTIAA